MSTSLADRIAKFHPCSGAVDWMGARTLEQAWTECERADWLLWLAAKVGVDRKLVVLAACACARTALEHVPEGEARPLKAIETAEAWTRGEATLEEVRRAAAAADAADADAAAAAADAAAYADAAADAASAARAKSLKDLCPLVRQHISVEAVEAALAAREKEAA